MKKVLPVLALAALGVVLLAPRVWDLATYAPMRLADVPAAFKPFAEVPISQLEGRKSVDLDLTLPNDPAWKRIRHSWGDPVYAVALVSSHGEYQHCFDGLNVQVTRGETQVSLKKFDYLFYGFSAGSSAGDFDCKSLGEIFRVPPGSKVQIHIKAEGDQLIPYANLIVRANWYNTKDHIMGL